MSERNSNPVETISNENVKRILALLRSGDEKIISGYHDVVLIIGNTGSGKSTLTHFLAGNNNDLRSIEVGDGSGEYVISDTNNKISLDTTVISKTTFPEVVFDHGTKTAYIDCPGFNDSRNEAYDIAAAYFIKKVLQSVQNVKIILTVSYPSLRKGVNRNDFMQLLEHVGILLKDITKYADGVALIATKVDNQYVKRKEGPVLIPDGTVVDNIAQFLREVRQSMDTMRSLDQVYKSEFKQAKNELFFENSKRLLDILLLKNTEYSRIGIFRRPDASGKLSEIQLLQDGKTILKNMIKHNLKYSPVNITNIGYAVSDKSKNIIIDLVQEINQNIVVDMGLVKDVLIDHCKQLEAQYLNDDMYTLRDHLISTSIALSQITNIPDSTNAHDVVSTTLKAQLAESCKRASKYALDDIANLGEFLTFLQEVSDKPFESSAWKWLKQLDDAIAYVDHSLKWYNSLETLHERLSEYDIQKNTTIYSTPSIQNVTGTLREHSEFQQFLNEIGTSNYLKLVNLKELEKVPIDSVKARYFDKVISSTLKDTLTCTELNSGELLQVTGEYVKLSDITETPQYKFASSLQILAKHTIFIDADLSKNHTISIIAPRWTVIGNRLINLNGSPGSHHLPAKAYNGQCAGCKGQDGHPGNPGSSAGHFFGIGAEFGNIHQLKITAIGGDGGIGQHGGDGASGSNGQTFPISYNDYNLSCDVNQHCTTNIEKKKSGLARLKLTGKITYRKYGSPGERGGNCGRGGGPGVGGYAGTIKVLGVGTQIPAIAQIVKPGNEGLFGLHGRSGAGGIGGNNYEAIYKFSTWSKSQNEVYTIGKAADGVAGSCFSDSSLANANMVGRGLPQHEAFIHSPSPTITNFRNQLLGNLNDCVKKRQSMEFYKKLQNEDILHNDTVQLIMSELQHLENHSNQLTLDVKIILHKYLQQRIEKLSRSLAGSTNPNERALLDSMNLYISSKSIGFINKLVSRLVFDQKSYFNLVKTADVDKIRQFFYDRAIKDTNDAVDFVKTLNNDILDIIKDTTINIIRKTQENNDEDLRNELLKLKLFSKLKTIGKFLLLSGVLAKADVALSNNQEIRRVTPVIDLLVHPVVEPSIRTSLDTLIEEVINQATAITRATSKEARSLRLLGDEFDQISDQLYIHQEEFHSLEASFKKQYNLSAFHLGRDKIIRSVHDTNSAYIDESVNDLAHQTVAQFDDEVKLITFEANLFNDLIAQNVDLKTVIPSVDHVQSSATILDDIESETFGMIASMLETIRQSLIGDRYQPQDMQNLREGLIRITELIKLQVYKLVKAFDIDEDLLLTTENMDEATNQLDFIYNVILPGQNYMGSTRSFYSYLENQSDLDTTNKDYFLKAIKADVLSHAYEALTDAYKKYITPYDAISTLDLSLPQIPSSDRSFDQYCLTIVSNINLLQSKLHTLEQTTQNYTIEGDFTSQTQNGAFFTWRSETYGESISKLLRGKKITLKAFDTGTIKEHLTFDSVRLRFQMDDATKQHDLEREMHNFNVIMTHTGSSYFHLCKRVQLIHQDAVKFIYNPAEATTKLYPSDSTTEKPNTFILSPYTTWTFKLEPSNKNATFALLELYRKSSIHLELEGHARYIENRAICRKIQPGTFATSSSEPTPSIDHTTPSVSTKTTTQDNTQITAKKRKRRHLDSPAAPFNAEFPKSFDHVHPDARPQLLKSFGFQLLEAHKTPSPPPIQDRSFDTLSTLTLLDYVVRNFTKTKPYRSTEKSTTADDARAIALSLVDKFETMLSNVSENRENSLEVDPTELMRELEKHILAGDYSAIRSALRDCVTLDPATEKYVEDELDGLIDGNFDGSTLRRFDEYHIREPEDDEYYTNGVATSFVDDAVLSSNENFNRLLLN